MADITTSPFMLREMDALAFDDVTEFASLLHQPGQSIGRLFNDTALREDTLEFHLDVAEAEICDGTHLGYDHIRCQEGTEGIRVPVHVKDALVDDVLEVLSVQHDSDESRCVPELDCRSPQQHHTDRKWLNEHLHSSGLCEMDTSGVRSMTRNDVAQSVAQNDGHILSAKSLTVSTVAPPEYLASSCASESSAEQTKDSTVDKAELRRMRNRESSARSYYSRKRKIDELDSELRQARSKATKLFTRELSLRQENTRLKRLYWQLSGKTSL